MVTTTENKKDIFPQYAISYVRVSTAKQTTESKTGIRRQLRAWEKWKEDHPHVTPWEQEFRDLGISGRGKHQTKGALANYLEQAERRLIPEGTVLVADSPSRLTREKPRDALKLLLRIFDLGHKISFCSGQWKGEIIESDTHGIWSRLVAAAEQSAGLWEERSNNSREFHNEKLERFKNGDLSIYFRERKSQHQKTFYPCWLDFHEDAQKGKEWTFNDHAKWIRQIFEWAPEIGSTEMSKRLYEQGLRSLRDKRKPISKGCINDQLTNRAVLGEFQPMQTKTAESGGMLVENRGEPIPGIFPPLITPEQFKKVGDSRQKRKRNKGSTPPPRPFNRMRHLFTNAIFCRECSEKVVFRAVPKATRNDPNAMYYYLECSAGYNRAVEICTCNKRFTAKKPGVDFELDALKRLQSFRWAEFFTDEKHEISLKAANAKKMRQLNKRNEADREVKKLRDSSDKYLYDGEKVPDRLMELFKKAEKKYEQASDQYNQAMIEESHLRTKKRGKDAEKDIQSRLNEFLDAGRSDLAQRQEFSRWFISQGMVIEIDLRTGKFEIGIGKIEKGVLTELDMTLEDAFVLGVDLDIARKMQKEWAERTN